VNFIKTYEECLIRRGLLRSRRARKFRNFGGMRRRKLASSPHAKINQVFFDDITIFARRRDRKVSVMASRGRYCCCLCRGRHKLPNLHIVDYEKYIGTLSSPKGNSVLLR